MNEVPSKGGVQSLERAFGLLELVAAHRGAMSLSELATASGLPPADPAPAGPHARRPGLPAPGAVPPLRARAAAVPARRELLDDAQRRRAAAPGHLVDEIGETANLAMLDGDQVAYVAQAPGRHSMRMFTEVGRRVHPHCTAVGKALLAALDGRRRPGPARSAPACRATRPHTVTDPDELLAQLDRVRDRGYAMDEGEQEVGVRCVAVAVPESTLPLAMSVSGPAPRMTDDLVARRLPGPASGGGELRCGPRLTSGPDELRDDPAELGAGVLLEEVAGLLDDRVLQARGCRGRASSAPAPSLR